MILYWLIKYYLVTRHLYCCTISDHDKVMIIQSTIILMKPKMNWKLTWCVLLNFNRVQASRHDYRRWAAVPEVEITADVINIVFTGHRKPMKQRHVHCQKMASERCLFIVYTAVSNETEFCHFRWHVSLLTASTRLKHLPCHTDRRKRLN